MMRTARTSSGAALVVVVALGLVSAGCGGAAGEASPYRIYQDVDEMTAAIQVAGLGCETVDQKIEPPDDRLDPDQGVVGGAWCLEDAAAMDSPGLIMGVLASEAARVLVVASDPACLSSSNWLHVYGPNWVIQGYPEEYFSALAPQLATTLGGRMATVDCTQLEPLGESVEDWGVSAFDSDEIALLKAALGEEDFPGVDEAQFPQPPAASG